MIELPQDAEQACNRLRGIMPRPGAETRVYRRIVNRPHSHQLWAFRIALVPVVLVMAGSLAYGFVGIAKQVFVGSPETTKQSQVTEQLIRARSKQKRARSQQPLTPPLDSSQPSVGDIEQPSLSHESDSESRAVVPIFSALPTATEASPPDHAKPQALAPNTSRDHKPFVPNAKSASRAAGVRLPEVGKASQLDLEVADYQAALALSQQDPQAALVRLQAHRRKWPSSALLHEVDLRIVQILTAQGSKSEAQTEAQRFLERHPDSARLTEMRRIAGQATSDE